ncbi:branched-chain amino acid ABC transporter permease [Gellertiella hungarica]|uniref:Branched-chain amino acid transport system permease protein n=1 Tax=Gellertiella hungarica TaxID=1572859 RepID=A0A7W6J6C7_9HYPH|nr:branched-chain amino acid ABC transporter permease [Gellertiella hungarica]MBB4065621.1 branched-chain amino acid transport system permease protein [Gellertiella hungarica]
MNMQFLVDGLLTGSMIGLGAIGVTLTYSILRFSNFSHGDLMAWGTYATLMFVGAITALFGKVAPIAPLSFGWPLLLALALGMLFTGGLALLLDKILFQRLRAKGQMIIVVMASFGASMALRSLLEFLFTSSPAYFSRAIQIAKPIGFGIRITPDQIALLLLTAALVTAVHLLMTRSQIGREMRAVSQNIGLARVVGIDVARVVRFTWLIGGALACVAGVMIGVLVQIRPLMGFDMLLPVFAAAILGGIGSIPGAVLGGLIIGLSEAAAVQIFGAEWRAAIAFVILMAVLFVRPIGLFGVGER